ncbi:MAG TPA: ester cyclase [Sphingomonadaceae bacterium]
MRIMMVSALAATAMLWTGCASAQTKEKEMADPAPVTAPKIATDHAALLASDDPKLAANKRLVYDMYRIVLQAGIWERAGEFIADGYIQHNPNAGQGLSGVQEYIRKTRPERPISDKLELPLIQLIAEGDYVMTAFVRPEKDAAGGTYYSTWFDLYRIENGKIAEHWDPMLKSDKPIDPNTQKL